MTTPNPDPTPDVPEDADAIWDAQFESDADPLSDRREEARTASEAGQTDAPDGGDKEKAEE